MLAAGLPLGIRTEVGVPACSGSGINPGDNGYIITESLNENESTYNNTSLSFQQW
jgi:hypothetical protein